ACLVLVCRYRQVAPTPGPTPRVRASLRLEVGGAGAILALFIAWWGVGLRLYVRMQTPPAEALEVYVTAKQWMWKLGYPDGRDAINTLTVPAGRPVKLHMISRDVIHSFFVPAFRLKHDVLPGRTTTLWFQADAPGTYPILCAEYCGLSHSEMRGVVRVLDADAYAAWLAEPGAQGTDAGAGSMVQQGEAAARRHGCFACHTTDGQRHIGPSWRGLYGATIQLADGAQTLADEAYLTESMMDPRAKLVAGYPANMPTYQGQLDPTDAAAIVAYIKGLPGQRSDAVFPARQIADSPVSRSAP
ncbi:MAG TPA: c-type cytochrome, partial [Myxococcota bacterium]|nr:c-type cytochrome [Myxococcota bacterium]